MNKHSFKRKISCSICYWSWLVLLNSSEMKYGICQQKQKNCESDQNFAELHIVFDVQP